MELILEIFGGLLGKEENAPLWQEFCPGEVKGQSGQYQAGFHTGQFQES